MRFAMEGSLKSSYIFLVLLALMLGKGQCIVDVSIPPSGSILEGYEGDQNVTIFCNVTLNDGTEQVTTWSIQREGQSNPTSVINDLREKTITITSDITGNETDFLTNFTILSLTLDWHNAIIFCGVASAARAGNFSIKIFMPPASPTNISVKDIGPTFATLNWVRPSNPGHPELSEYAIWYQRADGMGPNETLSTTDSCINITDLAPGVSYRGRVMASSQKFMGNFSEPFVFLTSFTLPTINCLTTPEEGSGNITFRWTVTDAGGEEAKMTSIRIDYKSNTNNAFNFSLLNIANLTDEAMDPKLLTVDTGFLNAGESYSFRISAGNNVGIGEPTDCPAVTLLTGQPGVPDTPVINMAFPDSVRLKLRTVNDGVHFTPHSFGFQVVIDNLNTSTIKTDTVKTFSHYEDGENVIVMVTNLVPETMYQFAVKGINEFGTSEASNFSESVFLKLSEPLVGDVVFEMRSNQVVLTWSFIHTGGLSLTRVIVEVRINGGNYALADGGDISDPDISRTINIAGAMLRAGVTYQYRVTASNELGASPSKETTAFTAQIGVPMTPNVPEVESIQSNGVTLTLHTSASGTDGSFVFVVYITKVQSSTRQVVSRRFDLPMYEDGDEVQVTIGLDPGTYQFQAQAENKFGASEISLQTGSVNVRGGGLSSGVIAAIVIVVVLLVVVAIVIILILLCVCFLPTLKPNTKNSSSRSHNDEDAMPLEFTTKTMPPDVTKISADEGLPDNTYATITETQSQHNNTPDSQRKQGEAYSLDDTDLPDQEDQDTASLYDSLAPPSIGGSHHSTPLREMPPSPRLSSHSTPLKEAANPLYAGVGRSDLMQPHSSYSASSRDEPEGEMDIEPEKTEFLATDC